MLSVMVEAVKVAMLIGNQEQQEANANGLQRSGAGRWT